MDFFQWKRDKDGQLIGKNEFHMIGVTFEYNSSNQNCVPLNGFHAPGLDVFSYSFTGDNREKTPVGEYPSRI